MPHRINRLHVFVLGVFLLGGPRPAMAPPLQAADIDGDGDVDNYDVGVVIACMSGPDVPLVGICEIADFSGDGDIDQADFGFIQRCISGENVFADDPACIEMTPRLANYGNSGCHHTPMLGDDYPWCGDDIVEIMVEGYSLRIVHRNAAYNCCPEDIRVDLVTDGNTLHLEETELVTMPCPCLCCYDIESVIVDLRRGYYWV